MRPEAEQEKRVKNVGWVYLVDVIDYCTRQIVGWDLSLRCRTQEAIAAVERGRCWSRWTRARVAWV